MSDFFQSDDPASPTLEDEFRMDLCATLGYKSVVDLMEIDSVEYSFWFERYKKSIFGPCVNNKMLAQASYLIANMMQKSNINYEDLVFRVVEPPSENDRLEAACSRYHAGMVRFIKNPDPRILEKLSYSKEQIERIAKGFKDTPEDNKEASDLARIESDRYRKGIMENGSD